MTWKVSTATGTVLAVACFPEQGVFIVRNICKTCVRYFFVNSLWSCLYHLARWPRAWNSSYLFISLGEM